MRVVVHCLSFLLLISSSHQYFYYSTHTPYELVRGDIRNATWDEGELLPQQIYVLARHGSRHFGKRAPAMTQLVDFLLETNLSSRYPWLTEWKRTDYSSDGHLLPEGMLEHYHTARRYRSRFPTLFPDYYPGRYRVRATEIPRTSQSAASYMYGLFEGQGPVDASSTRTKLSSTGFMPTAIEIQSIDRDILLRFMDEANCPAYANSHITKSAKGLKELIKKSPFFEKAVLKPLAQNMGFALTADQAESLHDLCSFEVVSPTEAHFSSFCDMIPHSAMELLDFSRDLSRYYKSSYPNKLGYELGCVVLQDLLESFQMEPFNPTLRFAHSETIVPVITLLGLFKDDETTYQGFENRAFRMSEIDPFGGNLVFVLFKNTTSDEDIIKIYLHEKEVHPPACSSPDFCTINDIQKIIDSTQGSCNVRSMCSNPSIVLSREEFLRRENSRKSFT